MSREDASRRSYEDQVKAALSGRRPDDMTIMFAIGRDDFENARKMIELLPDGERKARHADSVNAREAVSLADRNETTKAERLALQLIGARAILEAYPAIIEKCVAAEDLACASNLTYQAMKQLRRAPDADLAPLGLSRPAKSVAPLDETLALEVLDEAVRAANLSDMDTNQGRVGIDSEIFRTLAPKNEARVKQAAAALKDRLQNIVANAAIYQSKARELDAKTPSGRRSSN